MQVKRSGIFNDIQYIVEPVETSLKYIMLQKVQHGACNETSHSPYLLSVSSNHISHSINNFRYTYKNIHNTQLNHSFTRLTLYSHISHSSQSYGHLQPQSFQSRQNFSLAQIEMGIIKTPQTTTGVHALPWTNAYQQTHTPKYKTVNSKVHTYTQTQ